jgi:hypothetical protein
MTSQQVALDSSGYRKAIRHGLMGALWLTVLTIIEFIIAVVGDGEPWLLWALLPFVLLKGWIILDTFMHIRALWSEDH